MKKLMLLLLIVPLASSLAELKAATYFQGRIASMRSVPCGEAKIHNGMGKVMCEQYVVRTDTMRYRIRQEVPKQVNLLPVGQVIYFRIKKNRMLVRGYSLNGEKIKDQEYLVIAEHPRRGAEAGRAYC
jgi:hypothetical protein